jgi:hypothetical protein
MTPLGRFVVPVTTGNLETMSCMFILCCHYTILSQYNMYSIYILIVS